MRHTIRNRTCTLIVLLLAASLLLAACDEPEAPIPTRIPSVDALATSVHLTENAPPEGFRDPQAFPRIDANLNLLPNWRYEVTFAFDGVFTGTPRSAQASTSATVWFNRLDTSRRVVVTTAGLLAETPGGDPLQGEAVRLGPDTFLVRDTVCAGETEAAAALADLQAGDLIGGVQGAIPVGQRATINGETVYRYGFGVENLTLPGITFSGGGGVTALSGELWIAPEHNVVVRFWVTMDVDGAVIPALTGLAGAGEDAANTPPISGQLIVRYDLFDIGVNPNITVPFGC